MCILKCVLEPYLGLVAMSGPDGDQASSVESSSVDTDDEKDLGREIGIYLNASAN